MRLVYEDPDHVAYNSQSIRLQAEEFSGRHLSGCMWQAELEYATGLPNDVVAVLVSGEPNHGKYRIDFKHSREWRWFRYRCPKKPDPSLFD